MPIKVRCGGCDKSLSVPDSMLGKTVKCPACGDKLKIPGGDADAAPKKAVAAKTAKRAKEKKEPSLDDKASGEIFVNLNLKQLEAEDEQICPFCAAPMPKAEEDDEEITVCPNCGMDVSTGKMDKKEAKRRSRKGPDIKEFWGKAWSDPFQFVKTYKTLAIRTGTFWTQFGMAFAICLFMAKDFCTRGPIITFWACLAAVTMLGMPGWYWTLAIKLVQTELFREKVNTDRIHFDFFANVSIGLRGVIWPFVVFLPAWMALGVLYLISPDAISEETFRIVAGVLIALPFLTFPLATIHMTGKYTYKAWILWELLVTFARCGAGCFYWLLQAVIVMGPIAGIFAALHFFGGGINPLANTYVDDWAVRFTVWILGLMGEQPNAESFMFTMIRIATELTIAFFIIAPLAYLTAFPAMFMMRSNAVLAYYFEGKLGVVNDMPKSKPATFWVRFLAFWGDMLLFLLAPLLVMRIKKAVMVGWLLVAAVILTKVFRSEAVLLFQILCVSYVVYTFWMYFAVSESGGVRATTVKEAFGLAVQTFPKGKQLTLKQASIRWFGTMLSALTGGLGFVMSVFHPKKRAIQDLMSKSEVVWVGDK